MGCGPSKSASKTTQGSTIDAKSIPPEKLPVHESIKNKEEDKKAIAAVSSEAEAKKEIEEYSRYLCYPENEGLLHVYDLEELKYYSYTHTAMSGGLYYSGFTKIGKRLYFAGGYDCKEAHNRCLLLELSLDNAVKESNEIASMISPKMNNGLVGIHQKLLLSIGGCNSAKSLSDCERYDFKIGKWFKDSPLQEAKASVSCSLFQNTYVYAFGGLKKGGNNPRFSDFVERKDLTMENSEWEKLKNSQEDCFINCSSCQLDSESLLVFGHASSASWRYLVASFEMDTLNSVVPPPENAGFCYGAVRFKTAFYCVDKELSIIKYDISIPEENTLSKEEKEKWMTADTPSRAAIRLK